MQNSKLQLKNQNWPTKKLGEVAQYINGRAFKPSEWVDSGLPIIRIQNLTGTQEKFNYFNGKLEERYIVEKGDILLSWSASLGVYVWDKERAALNQHIFKVLPRNIINKGYLLYVLLAVIERLKKQVHGSTMTHITKPTFERNKIPLPPLNIQNQIVEQLDAIKKAQELNEKQIELTEELFQSLLHRELNPKGKNWEIKKLGELIQTQYGYTAAAKETGNYRFIRITDIDEEGNLKNIEKKYISADLKDIKGYILKKEDLLLARTGSIGKMLYFCEDEPAIFASYLIRLFPDTSKIMPKYLWLFSHTSGYWRQVELFAGGAVQPQFNANRIKQIKIPLPPLETQRKIVGKLSSVQEYKKKLLAQKQKLQELFESYLNKAMKGELVR